MLDPTLFPECRKVISCTVVRYQATRHRYKASINADVLFHRTSDLRPRCGHLSSVQQIGSVIGCILPNPPLISSPAMVMSEGLERLVSFFAGTRLSAAVEKPPIKIPAVMGVFRGGRGGLTALPRPDRPLAGGEGTNFTLSKIARSQPFGLPPFGPPLSSP